MKLLTCVAVIALSTATASFAQSSNMGAPGNTPTSPDQSVQTSPNSSVPPQHSLAPSSPAGMGGSNTTQAAPDRTRSSQAMDRSKKAPSTHATAVKRQGSGRDDQAENRITEDLNRQQVAQGNAAPNSQTARTPADCSLGQAGCAPAPSGATPTRVGPMP